MFFRKKEKRRGFRTSSKVSVEGAQYYAQKVLALEVQLKEMVRRHALSASDVEKRRKELRALRSCVEDIERLAQKRPYWGEDRSGDMKLPILTRCNSRDLSLCLHFLRRRQRFQYILFKTTK